MARAHCAFDTGTVLSSPWGNENAILQLAGNTTLINNRVSRNNGAIHG
jgi:hypothetical protein